MNFMIPTVANSSDVVMLAARQLAASDDDELLCPDGSTMVEGKCVDSKVVKEGKTDWNLVKEIYGVTASLVCRYANWGCPPPPPPGGYRSDFDQPWYTTTLGVVGITLGVVGLGVGGYFLLKKD